MRRKNRKLYFEYSLGSTQFVITNACKQSEPETKTLSSITVALGNDFESLDKTNSIFVADSLAGEITVIRFIFFVERLIFRLFSWSKRVYMDFRNTLKP